MSAPSFLNAEFDDEESDNDFNPGAERGSDGEDNGSEGEKPLRRGTSVDQKRSSPIRSPRRETNGDSSPPPTRVKDRRPSEEADEVNGDDEEELDGDNGEDDEGEGEDLLDDDEDEEDEEDEIQGRSAKRQKRGRRLNQFIEEEAEVDDDDDDLDVDEDDIGGDFVQETHPDDDLPAEAETDDRRHRELDRKRQLEASMDAEKQAAEFRERYGRRTTTALSNAAFVPQNLLMPDINDPKIYSIRCREGKEKEIVQKLMRKMEDSRGSRNPPRICSVFERGESSMKGYIFVESKLKSDVEDILNGVNDVYPRFKMQLIPIKEMPDLLRVAKSKELNPGDYVRIKKGLYTGDLAVVEDVVANGLDVTVKVVPRLTYGADEDDSQSASQADAKRKRGFGQAVTPVNRPPARLFNENEAKKKHARFLTSNRGLTGKSFTYRGEMYEDGFLIKDFKLQHLTTENVQPKLEETQMFTKTGQDGSETLDLETLKKSLHDNTSADSSYQVGDEVEVFSGEQRGIIGRTERVSGNIVSIKVSEGELAGQIVEVPVRSLRKRFREGDNVIVVGASKYRDQVGTVLLIKDEKVTILTQEDQKEITVFSRDLREASGVAASSERSKFDVRDLVQLTATSFGCIVSANPQSVMVMDTNGEVFPKLPSAISKIELPRRPVSVDKNGSEIKVGDAVKEVAGEGHSGNIIQIYRNFLYAVDRSRMVEHAGIWVARCNNVISRGGKVGASAGMDISKINPALKSGAANGGPMLPPQRPGLDRLIKKRVRITKGPYKGHRGIVKDTTAGEARIELESKNKVVNINKLDLKILEPGNDNGTPYVEWVGKRGGPPPQMATGGSRIPDAARISMDGGRTPAWGAGSRTPAWDGAGSSAMDGGRTPGWQRPSGSTTSYGGAGNMTSYGGAGNMTSYGGAGNTTSYGGSRTPAWGANSKTPYSGDSGFSSRPAGDSAFDSFVSGSRTPAHQPVSRTPAWAGPGAASAPTPAARGYDAPTPAASAPTPGASRYDDDSYTPAYTGAPTPGAGFGNDRGPIDAPTPGGFAGDRIPGYAHGANKDPLKFNRLVDAPTPAANAPTPYASGHDAPTPAAGGGPQYVDDDDDE